MMIRTTCKSCGLKGHLLDFKDGCPNEECMSRRGRNNKPVAILRPVTHNANCTCDRCLDADTANVADQLDRAWQAHNKEMEAAGEVTYVPNIRAVYRESPAIGPAEDVKGSLYVTVPMAICGTIYATGKRRRK